MTFYLYHVRLQSDYSRQSELVGKVMIGDLYGGGRVKFSERSNSMLPHLILTL